MKCLIISAGQNLVKAHPTEVGEPSPKDASSALLRAGFGWSVATVGLQFERDAYRNGLGFYATADHNSISADSGFGGDTGSFFGFGLGTRYQLQSGIRLFAEGKLHSGDFGFLSGGARFRF